MRDRITKTGIIDTIRADGSVVWLKGYLVCRVCGNREPQSTYDCDVKVVCNSCATKRDAIIAAEDASGICQSCYCDPCECLPDDCDCDPE